MGKEKLKIALISLGCAKNLVDSEVILGSLLQHEMALTTDTADADVLLINTCSFIESAQEESISVILEAGQRSGPEPNRERPEQAIVVTGCLPQRFAADLPALMPEVDAFMGVDQLEEAPKIIRQAIARRREVLKIQSEHSGRRKQPPLPPPSIKVNRRPAYIHTAKTPRLPLTPGHFTYIKIAEGCNHSCTFCAIPQIRGRYRSRGPEDILEEARGALKRGVRELNLISQDTTWYGHDLLRLARKSPPSLKLPAEITPEEQDRAGLSAYLLRKVSALRGDFWVRLLYTHPAHWSPELIEAMARAKKAVKYVDIPLQHIHPVMLERMGRRTSEKTIRKLLEDIRRGIPGVTLRTTFIVGFPGETEEYFQSLLDFVAEQRFQKVGAFTYSAQEGTRAGVMSGTVPEAIKRKRLERLMRLQRDISLRAHQEAVGSTQRVLVERQLSESEAAGVEVSTGESGQTRGSTGRLLRLESSYWVARAAGDAPDVDGRVYLRHSDSLKAGEFARVRITDCREYDLLGEALEP